MKKNHLLVFAFLLSLSVNAQKAKVIEGSYKNLKGITVFNLEFDYSNLEIPKYKSEEEFLKDKMKIREDKKPGDGERFRKSWFADREERFEPKFKESFNKRFKDGKVKVGKDISEAKHVMKIYTTKMYAGYNVGVWRHNSEIDAILTVYEKANPSNVLISVKYRDVQGQGAMGYDYNSGYRISECYAKLAKVFAFTLKNKTKK